jgi:hypothetical protein
MRVGSVFNLTLIALIAGLLYSAGMAQANVLSDPMRPTRIKRILHATGTAVTEVKSAVVKKKKWQLSAIIYRPDTDSHSAIVNGLNVKQGSRVSGATIRSIDDNSVELRRKGKTITLRLNPRVKIGLGG